MPAYIFVVWPTQYNGDSVTRFIDMLFYCHLIALCSNKLGDKLDGYQKKKYVCKLIFIFLLGNNIEFGHQEAVNLLASLKFSEKQIVSFDHYNSG